MDLKQETDEDIIKLILSDASAYDVCFREIYSRHSKWVYNKALQFVDATEAEDLLQEVFIKVFMNLAKFHFNSKFSTWLFSITYNTCVNKARAAKRNQNLTNNYSEEVNNLLDSEMDSDEVIETISIEVLEELMEQIEPEEKQILLMKYQDNLPIIEIANIFKTTEGAIKMRLKRAKNKLVVLQTKIIYNE